MRSSFDFIWPIMVSPFFFLPISTAATNIFLGLSVIYALYLILFDICETKNLFFSKSFPFLAFILFFVILSLSSIFISANWHESVIGLNKYLEIILVPLLAFSIARYENLREKCLNGFLIALLITLTASYLRYFDAFILNIDLVKWALPKLGDISNPTVFRWHITHNFFMAFAVIFWGHCVYKLAPKKNLRFYFYLFLALAGLYNILFMVQGRTGYITLLCGVLYFFIWRFGYKGLFLGWLAVGFLIAVLLFFSANFYNRIALGFFEMQSWSPNEPTNTSIGLRLEFFFNSIQIVSNNFLFGFGVGNFAQVYGEHAASYGLVKSENPHGQYILFLVETGLLGLLAFFALNIVCWKFSVQLSGFWKHATRIVLLSYGVANLFNSFLFDFAESLFFSMFMALAFSELIKFKKSSTKVN